MSRPPSRLSHFAQRFPSASTIGGGMLFCAGLLQAVWLTLKFLDIG